MGFFKEDKQKEEVPTLPKVARINSVTQEISAKTVIGKTVQIKGEVKAEEEMLIEGRIEGEVRSSKKIIIGHQGDAKANLYAPYIKVAGKVIGNLIATAKIEIESTAHVEGNITAPKLSVSESAFFKGNIDMSSKADFSIKSTEKLEVATEVVPKDVKKISK